MKTTCEKVNDIRVPKGRATIVFKISNNTFACGRCYQSVPSDVAFKDTTTNVDAMADWVCPTTVCKSLDGDRQ